MLAGASDASVSVGADVSGGTIALIVVGWLACAAISYAGAITHLWREFPSIRDPIRVHVARALFPSILLGPVALLAGLWSMDCFMKHGLSFRPWRRP